MRRLLVALSVAGSLLAAAPQPACASDVDAAPGEPSEPVDLESLLKLPDGFGAEIETRQGATKLEWLGRFEQARKDLESARESLSKVEKELDSASQESRSWQVSAPGATNPETSPISIRLRNEVKRLRQEITDATRRLRALDVQADLAGVPQDWRQ